VDNHSHIYCQSMLTAIHIRDAGMRAGRRYMSSNSYRGTFRIGSHHDLCEQSAPKGLVSCHPEPSVTIRTRPYVAVVLGPFLGGDQVLYKTKD
jgi:hypothetical protein